VYRAAGVFGFSGSKGREAMKKRFLVFFLLVSAAVFVYSQDEAGRLLNLLDEVLSTATEVGRPRSGSALPNSPETPTFIILNNTGFTVKNILASRADTDNWNIIFTGNLYNGHSARITLKAPLNEINRYNIRMVDDGGDYYAKYGVEISEFITITISINDFE
jgi:hypothetical protein